MDERWDNDLNKRIREVFDNYEDTSADEGWQLLREKYPEKAKRRIAGWWWIGSAAALLLLFIGMLWYRSGTNNNTQPLTDINKRRKPHTTSQIARNNNNIPKHDSVSSAKNNAGNPVTSPSAQNTIAQNQTGKTKTLNAGSQGKKLPVVTAPQNTFAQTVKKQAPKKNELVVPDQHKNSPSATLAANPSKQPAVNPADQHNQETVPKDNRLIANVPPKNDAQVATSNPNAIRVDTGIRSKPSNPQYTVNMVQDQAKKHPSIFDNNNVVDNKTPEKKTLARGNAITVGVYAATYYNYAKGSSNQFNVGGGIVSDIRLVGNLKLSTGIAIGQNSLSYTGQVPSTPSASSNDLLAANSTASFTTKLYTASTPQFKSYDASLVDLDIPLNLKYVFANKSGTYILAGISSGTFISESYTYSFNNPSLFNANVAQVQNQATTNSFSSFYFAKTLNVAFGTGYTIGRSQLIVEPFLKYPLDGLGSQQLKFGAGGVNLKFGFSVKKK